MNSLRSLDDRFRLVGNEDGGVSIGCLDCDDGGRPLAYYEGGFISPLYANDPLVENVSTISGLFDVAFRHKSEAHPSPHKHLDVNTLSDEEYAEHRAGMDRVRQAEQRRMLARARGGTVDQA